MAGETNELLTEAEIELVDGKDDVGGGFGGDGWQLVSEPAKPAEADKAKPADTSVAKPEEKKEEKAAAPVLDSASLQTILDNQARTFKSILDTEATRSREAVTRLENKIETLAKAAPAKQTEEEQVLTLPTPEEWREDENKAMEKAHRFYSQRDRKEAEKARAEERAREASAQKELQDARASETLKADQNKAWAAAVRFEPELAKESSDPQHVRNLTASILHSDETGLKNNPKGPFIAAMMAISIAKRIEEGRGSVDTSLEDSRRQRLKTGHVRGGKEGGQGGGAKDDKLSDEEMKIVNMMGVKPETYLESRKQLSGGM